MFKPLLQHHTTLEKQLEQTSAAPVEAMPLPVRDLHSTERCPSAVLPWLAWERRVDFWRDDWPEQTKRAVVAASISTHRRKGTRRSIREAIAATGIDAELSVDRERDDWTPHSFVVSVDMSTFLPTDASVMDLRYVIDANKPVRCGYDLVYKQPEFAMLPESMRVGAGAHLAGYESAAANHLDYVDAVDFALHQHAACVTHLQEAA